MQCVLASKVERNTIFGDDTLSKHTLQDLFTLFWACDYILEPERRPVCLSKEEEYCLRQLMESDPRCSTPELAQKLGVKSGTIGH